MKLGTWAHTVHLGISKIDFKGSFEISGKVGKNGRGAGRGSGRGRGAGRGSGKGAGHAGKGAGGKGAGGKGAGGKGAEHTCFAGTTAFEMHVHGLATGGTGTLAPHPHLLTKNAYGKKNTKMITFTNRIQI